MTKELKDIINEMKEICDVWVKMPGRVKWYNQNEIHLIYKYITNLQQENQQLKEINKELTELSIVRFNELDKATVENGNLKFRLDEIREYIDNYDVFIEFSFPLLKRDEENQVKSSIDYEFQTSIKNSLLLILDKVKE